MTALPTPRPRFTAAEYLEFEETANERHEFHDGEILAMSGGSPDHSEINTNAIVAIRNVLRGKSCKNYDSNLRIRIPTTNKYLYPDQSIICGPREFDPDDPKRRSVTNPRVLIEVLSPSTEAYDRGEKFEFYRRLASFQEYVLISQTAPRVETFVRGRDVAWAFTPFSGLDATLLIATVDVRIPLADIYAGVEFPPPSPSPDVRERYDNGEM
jgi:Uma2 family endonuclease